MSNVTQSYFNESRIGVVNELPHAGSSMEVPWLYDHVANKLCELAAQGMIEVVSKQIESVQGEPLITRFAFKRLR